MAATAKTQKQSYPPAEAIVADFSGFPGTNDWIAIAKVGDPDEQCSTYESTDRQESGTLTFKGMPEGEYELRGFFNWKSGGYNVQTRTYFNVDASVPTPATLTSQKQSFAAGETITIDFSGFPGTNDWVCVAPAGTPDDKCRYTELTDKKESGTLSFKGQKAGSYEARGYFNWKDGGYTVATRCQFEVF